MDWLRKGALQSVCSSILVQTGVAGMIASAILLVVDYIFTLSIEWYLFLLFSLFAFTAIALNQGTAYLDRREAQRVSLNILSGPITFAQNCAPFGEMRFVKLSDIDERVREWIEIEKKMPPFSRGPSADGIALFQLFRIGIVNRTGRTIQNARLELTDMRPKRSGLVPSKLRRRHWDDPLVDLTAQEPAYYDIVSVPVMSRSEWENKPRPSMSSIYIHHAGHDELVRSETYELLFTARGDDVVPTSAWFRLEMKDNYEFDLYELEESANGSR